MTDPDWCRENPREAAAEIDRMGTRISELEQLAAAWRDLFIRANLQCSQNTADIADIMARAVFKFER